MQEVRTSGGMLLLARKRRLLTQTELSERTGLPQTLISRLENSVISAVTEDQLEKLASALSFPPAFFQPHGEDVFKQPLSLHSAAFRKAASTSQKKVDFAIALANHYVIQARKLLDAVDLAPQLELPSFEIVDATTGTLASNARGVTSPEEAARHVRTSWQLNTGPIENLTALVEACGIIVIGADFEDVDVDGLTIRPIGLRPIILLNRNRPACRQRFSLAHELGHVVLHSYHSESMEVEANRFAAELLMPAKDIMPDFRQPLSLPRLGKLKVKWRTSMSAILYRAKEIGAIDEWESKHLWISLSASGYRTVEPAEFDIPREQSKTFRSLIDLYTDELGYGAAQLADLLETNYREFLHMAELQPAVEIKPKQLQLKIVVDNSTRTKRS